MKEMILEVISKVYEIISIPNFEPSKPVAVIAELQTCLPSPSTLEWDSDLYGATLT